MNKLTTQEQDTLAFIIDYRKTYGYNPTHVAIAQNMTGERKDELKRQSATAIIKVLKDKGAVIPTGRHGDYKISELYTGG